MKKLFVLLFEIGLNLSWSIAQVDSNVAVSSDPASLFNLANDAFIQDDYKKSETLYLQILENQVESAEVYFNLGNVYFKIGQIPNAILYYEKSKKLNPQDEDMLNNLQMANLKTTDKVESKPELAVTTWWETVLNISTVDEWGKKSIYLSFLSLAVFILFIVSKGLIKRLSFFGGIGIFGISLLFYLLAQQQKSLQSSDQYGIIFTPSVTVKSAPEEDGTKIFVIHEGTKVQVIENSGEWSRIALMNGNKGWIMSDDFRGI